MALALGATWVPRSAAEVESYLLRRAPRALRRPAGPRGAGLAAARGGPATRRAGRLLPGRWRPPIGVLPGWARRELGLSFAGPLDLLVDTAAVARRSCGGCPPRVRWIVDAARLSAAQVARDRPPSTTTTCPVT